MLKRWRLQWIIFALTCAVLLSFLAVAGALSNWYARRVITSNVSGNTLEMLCQINRMVEEQLTSIETMAVSMITNEALARLVARDVSADPYEQIVTLQAIERILIEYETMRSDIARIVLYTDRFPLFRYRQAWGGDSVLGTDTQSYKALEAYIGENDAGFTPVRVEAASQENAWRANAPEVTYYRMYRKFPSDPALGLLSIGIRADRINEKFGPPDDDLFYLLDAEGGILDGERDGRLGPEQRVELMGRFRALDAGSGQQIISIGGRGYILMHAPLTSHGMRAVQLKPYAEITKDLASMTWLIALAVLLLCLIAAAILWLLSRYLTRSLKGLVYNMNQLAEGNFQVSLGEGFSQEIAELNRNFMTMAYRIERLLKRVEDEGERNREATLNALQYQIDPHFLCNSLDAVNWMAIKIHADGISQMLSRIGQFYRLALRGTKDTVLVRDELELLGNYIELQKLCFTGKLNYVVDVDEDVMDLPILRVLLQPIVENAFKYAFAHDQADAEIAISAWREDGMLIINVADNGVGADAEVLNQQLASAAADGKQYGIKNVHWRIVLYYGADYGLKYLPVARGTVAMIRIPAAGPVKGGV